MNVAIDKFKEALIETRRMKSFEGFHTHQLKSRIEMLLENYLPAGNNYLQTLNQLTFPSANNMDYEGVDLQKKLIHLLELVIEDLQIKEDEAIKKSENAPLAEKYRHDMQKLRNDYEKDLLFERNNYEYLKKKYELLQFNYDQLKKEFNSIRIARNKWVVFFILSVPLILFLLTFDLITPLNPPFSTGYLPAAKALAALGLLSLFLYYPLNSKKLIIFGLTALLAAVAVTLFL